MSEGEPVGPYVYQPYGIIEKPWCEHGRLWGVSGIHSLSVIKGLTKLEAYAIVDTLERLRSQTDEPEQTENDDEQE